MSTPTDSPSTAADRDPVRDLRAHLAQALDAVDRLCEVLPPPTAPPPETGGGELV